MASRESALVDITPEVLLKAYACGIFPMAESADDPALYWIEPEMRGIIPLDAFHLPARLARTVRTTPFVVLVDRDFEGVIDGCAGHAQSWINREMRRAYVELFRTGRAHSAEARERGRLVGGVYGVHLGGAFMAESMFHRATDAGKVALAALVGRLRERGFRLLDVQMVTPATAPLGVVEIPRDEYLRRLKVAVALPVTWE